MLCLLLLNEDLAPLLGGTSCKRESDGILVGLANSFSGSMSESLLDIESSSSKYQKEGYHH